jgi:cytochrome b6-f complex iron-sulfur subunit
MVLPMDDSTYLPLPTSRRNFLSWLVGGWFTLTILPALYAIVKFIVPVSKSKQSANLVPPFIFGVEKLKPDSGYNFRWNNEPGLVIESNDETYKAFSARCTHLGCIVSYDAKLGIIRCPCHGGRYDLNGMVIAGPPKRQLTQWTVQVKGNEIHISKPPMTEPPGTSTL